MKKTIILGIVGVLLLAIVGATTIYSNKELAITAWNNYQIEKEDDIKEIMTSIEYKSGKICEIRNGKPECWRDVSYQYNNLNYEIKVPLPPDASDEEDEEIIRKEVNVNIEMNYPTEEFQYIEKEDIGTKIDLSRIK